MINKMISLLWHGPNSKQRSLTTTIYEHLQGGENWCCPSSKTWLTNGSQTNYIVDCLAKSKGHFIGHTIGISCALYNVYTTVNKLPIIHCEEMN